MDERRKSERREMDDASSMICPGKTVNYSELVFWVLLSFGIGMLLGLIC